MATDVEVSPKQTVIDYISAAACSSVRKTKGIRDFFSVSSKSTFANHQNSDGLETKLTAVATSSVLAGRTSNIEAELEREKDSDKTGDSSSKCDSHDKGENPFVVSNIKQNSPPRCGQGKTVCGLTPAGRKKKSPIRKEGREKRNDTCIRTAVIENGQKEDGGVSELVEKQSMPYEMDYGDFLKTFMQSQADNPVVVDVETEAMIVETDGNKELGMHKATESKKKHYCSEKKNNPTKKGACNKRSKTEPVTLNPQEPQEQSETNTRSKKPANVFSVLMQSKAGKNKEKCSEGDDCVYNEDTTAVDRSASTANSGDNCGVSRPENTSCTPSILNFFTKITKSVKNDRDSADAFIVKVDIHHDPTERKVIPVRKMPSSLQLQNVEKKAHESLAVDNEIIFLGSETIEEGEDGGKKHRRNFFKPVSPTDSLETSVTGSEAVNSECSKETVKTEGSKAVKPQCSKETVKTDCSKETVKTDCSKETVKTNCSKETVKTEYSKNAVKTDCSKNAAEKKNAFLQDLTSPALAAKTAQPTLHFGQGGKLAMNASVIAGTGSKPAKNASDNHDGTAHANVKLPKGKHVELSFSETICDLSDRKKLQLENIKRADTGKKRMRQEKDRPDQKAVPGKMNDITMNRRVTRLRKQTRADVGGSIMIIKNGSKSQHDCREESGNDSKDFTPCSKKSVVGNVSRSRAHELLMKARQKKQDLRGKQTNRGPSFSDGKKVQKQSEKQGQKAAKQDQKTDKQDSKQATSKQDQKEATIKLQVTDEKSEPDQGLRRSSRRLAELQKVRQAAEQMNCISVDSDSSSTDDTSSTQRKKAGGKKVLSHDSSSRSSPKKPVSKLAPIFAKKPKEVAGGVPQQPAEDPEVVRKRREFLLSGVPFELKRQAMCSESSFPASEFAPFPENSHVQQKDCTESGGLNVWSLRSPVQKVGFYKETEAAANEEIGGSVLDWASLHWDPVISEEKDCAGHDLLVPVCGIVEQEVKAALVAELQQMHTGFPFTTLFNRLSQQLTTAVRQDTAPSASVNDAKKRKVEDDVIIVDEPEEISAAQSYRDSQWTDRLQPCCASDMIGNDSCIRRLCCWLEEWRALIQREARLSVRSIEKTGSEEDSDFVYSPGDSEEEVSQLCNTMMLIGPHGTGKTAAVYALAQQLSYKVFEVNASSSRQGRHIVAQLQEATQSHQVAQKKDGIILSPPQCIPAFAAQPVEKPAEKKTSKKNAIAAPKAFASFFKQSEVTTSKASPTSARPKTDKKDQGSPKKETKKSKASAEGGDSRKRRRSDGVEITVVEEAPSPKKQCGDKKLKGLDRGKKGEESNLAGCLNLTSTSLILFDEVDLVFEEDSGFLQTVQHFISTTKIPIILTTADPHFHRLLNARMETLFFRSPPLTLVTSYLQTVCLVAGMRTSRDDVEAVADLCQGDMRHALLTLQFLTLSGGGRRRETQLIKLEPSQQHTEKSAENKLQQAIPSSKLNTSAADGSDSDKDFVCLKPARKKSRRIISDDDDSSRSSGRSEVKIRGQQEGEVKVRGYQEAGEVIAADRLPLVHLQLYQSVLGVASNLQDLLRKSIQEECDSRLLHTLTEEFVKLKGSYPDVLQSNLLQLLPLPKSALPTRWCRPSSPLPSTAMKRKRICSDIYDSEGSDEESKLKADPVCKRAVDSRESGTNAKLSKMDTDENKCEAGLICVKAEDTVNGSAAKVSEMDIDKSKGKADYVSVKAPESNTNKESGTGAETSDMYAGNTVSPKDSTEIYCEMSVENINTNSDKEEESKCERVEPMDSTSVPEQGRLGNNSKDSVQTNPQKKQSDGSKQPQKMSALRGSKKCTDHGLGTRLLSSFARHYECLSAMDTCRSEHPRSPYIRDRCWFLPGIDDVACTDVDRGVAGAWREGVEVEVLSSRHLWRRVSDAVSSWRQVSCVHTLPDYCSLPVTAYSSSASSSSTSFRLMFGKPGSQLRIPEAYSKVVTDVTEKLPFHIGSDAVILDYLPALRCISQAERCRQIAKTKRRFHHHFDNISLCLDRSTVTALCTDFPSQQPDL